MIKCYLHISASLDEYPLTAPVNLENNTLLKIKGLGTLRVTSQLVHTVAITNITHITYFVEEVSQ
jgi:hypothetical protein